MELRFNDDSVRYIGELRDIRQTYLIKWLLGGEFWWEEVYFGRMPVWVYERVEFDGVNVERHR